GRATLLPPGPRRAAVVVAVIHQGFDPQGTGPGAARQRVAQVGGIRTRLHPDPLLQEIVGEGIRPDRHRVFQPEPFEIAVAIRVNRTVMPAVREEGVTATAMLGGLIELSD